MVKHIPLNENEHRMQRYREKQLEPPCEDEEIEEIEEVEEVVVETEKVTDSQNNTEAEKENDEKEKADGNESDHSEKSRSSRSRSRSKSRSASGIYDKWHYFDTFSKVDWFNVLLNSISIH